MRVLVGTGEGAGAGVVLEAAEDTWLSCDISGRDGERSDEVERSGEASDRDADDACSSPRSRFLEVEALLASCTCFCSEIFWVIILATLERTPTMLGSDDFRFAAVRSTGTGFNAAYAAASRLGAGGTPPG